MSVKIGHASIDERGKASGGKAGDQTGKEVCTRQWYKKGWQYCLRPKSATVAERSAAACEAACANDSIGYDQSQRNTLHNLAKANNYKLSAVGKCETDCSALMTVCAIAGGVTELEHTGNAPTTSTMVAKFKASGAYDVLTADRYLSTDGYLKRGDILVKPGSHTVMVLTNGNCVAPATTTTTAEGGYCTVNLRVLKKGHKGEDVRALQRLLIAAGYSCGNSGADADFGGGTYDAVMAYQRAKGLGADGICGAKTWSKLLGV